MGRLDSSGLLTDRRRRVARRGCCELAQYQLRKFGSDVGAGAILAARSRFNARRFASQLRLARRKNRQRAPPRFGGAVEFYRRNLNILFDELHFALPNTSLIFDTTTPAIESRGNEPKRIFHRFNADIEAANDAAREIAARYDVTINDLWQIVQTHGPHTMINADGVHYDAGNSRILGEAMAGVITAELKPVKI